MKCLTLIALFGFVSVHAEPVTPQQLQAELDKAIAQGVPGVSAAIATRDGVIWTGVAGFADVQAKTPLHADHLFESAASPRCSRQR